MCELATQDSDWIMVDPWEASQKTFTRTAKVLEHFNSKLNDEGGCCFLPNGQKAKIRIVLLAGGDLIQSFAVPNLWNEDDV
jgi:nicotinamide mononucleotide adenylyltransferase